MLLDLDAMKSRQADAIKNGDRSYLVNNDVTDVIVEDRELREKIAKLHAEAAGMREVLLSPWYLCLGCSQINGVVTSHEEGCRVAAALSGVAGKQVLEELQDEKADANQWRAAYEVVHAEAAAMRRCLEYLLRGMRRGPGPHDTPDERDIAAVLAPDAGKQLAERYAELEARVKSEELWRAECDREPAYIVHGEPPEWLSE